VVRRARAGDGEAIRAVGAAAGERFRAIDDPSIAARADDPPFSAEGAAHVWVAEDGGAVVGFIAVDVVDRCAHVEELSVHPDHEGRGHGSALLDEVARWAADEGLAGVTLTTYRDVQWNRPFYERRGFRVLADDELTPGLRQVVAHEATIGLDPDLRVVMRRERPGAAAPDRPRRRGRGRG